jgi:uncharacterized protein (UPF0303 family)
MEVRMPVDESELIAELERQEERLVLGGFDNDDAWALGCLLVERAREQRLPVTIDIRRHGQQLFHAALPGTTPENDSWLARKARVVERFSASSYLVGRRLAAKGATLGPGHGVDEAEYAAHGGAFPLRVRGVGVVGSVAVSGLPQAEDHAFVVRVLGEFVAGRG